LTERVTAGLLGQGLPANLNAELGATKGAVFSEKRFRRINARRAFLVRARIEKIDLSLGDLSGADLRGATLEDVIADNARFEGCSFSDNMDSKGTDLAKQDAGKAHSAWFVKCHFKGTRFVRANICFVPINTSNFHQANLAFANCVGSQFFSCDLTSSTFVRAHLNYAQFVSIYPLGTNEIVDFREADCSNAKFRDSILRGAIFVSAILDHAKFERVDLANADFTNASLQETDLLKSTGLKEMQLRKAKKLYHAKLPEQPENLATILAKEVATPLSP